jgi:competence protein ComEC
MSLIPLAIAWMVGIAVGSWLKPPWGMPALLAPLFLFLLLLWYRQTWPRRLLVLALLAALGTLRWSLAQPSFGPGDVVTYAGQSVELRGTVIGEAESQSGGIAFPLQAEALRLEGRDWADVRGQVLVQGDDFLEVAYGDRLLLTGTLALPRSGGQFSYQEYLAREGIYVLLRDVQTVERLPEPGGSWPARVLLSLRDWARRRLESLLPEPQASLLVGILLGSRASIPLEVQEAFSHSGTSHILAISGWNINIVAAFLAAAGRRLPRQLSLILVLVGIVLYTLFVGAGAAVLRAALMGVLYVVAQQTGRPSHGLTALFASAWGMTLWSPGLLWDVSFQLSFGATLGMLLFVPVWTATWARWPQFLAESLAATISSQLLTWPILALYFRQFSLIVPLANLAACPALSPLMLFGALTLLLGAIPGLGLVLRGITWLLASYMLLVVGWTGGFSWAALPMPAVGPVFLVVYYGTIGWWWYRYQASDISKGT